MGWSYAGVLTRLGLSVGINILLARLIGPRPFGEIAIAQLLFGFGALISSVGISSALIQKPHLTASEIRFCFTAQMLTGSTMALTLFASSGFWAKFFHQPESVTMLRVFSLLFIFQALGTIANALLVREQDMRSVQLSSITSYLVGYLGFGVAMALHGAGVWSLVTAQLVQALLGSAISYARVRHPLLPSLHKEHYHFLSFGIRVLGANVSSWFISNMDNTIVGRTQGPASLGLYSRAFSLASMPAEGITSTLLGVLLAPMSRVQSDTGKLRNAYAGVMGLLLLILMPAFAGMAASPGAVIQGLYGPRWTDAAPIFQPLAIAIPINAIMALSGPVLTARGKPQREFVMQSLTAVVAVVTYYLAARHSLTLMAWMVVPIYLLRFLLLTRTALREIGGRTSDLAKTLWPGLLLGLIAALVSATTSHVVSAQNPFLKLVVIGTITASCVGAVLLLLFRQLSSSILACLPQLPSILPDRLRSFVIGKGLNA